MPAMSKAIALSRVYLSDPTDLLRSAIVYTCGLALVFAAPAMPF